MNSLEVIKNDLYEQFPDITMGFDPSESESGSSWLDIESDDQHFTVEWKPNSGFGLYVSSANSYGVGPTEIYRKKEVLLKRLFMLIVEKRFDVKMKELRELVGKTQDDLSIQMGQKQSSISKFESRSDVQISSIENFVAALGGTLEVKAHFNDFDLPIFISTNAKRVAG